MNKKEFYLLLLWKLPNESKSALMNSYIKQALETSSLLSLAGLQVYASMSDSEFVEWQEQAPRMFDWFGAFCKYINLDRAATKVLDYKAVSFVMLNEHNLISSRPGDKMQTDRGKKKILTLKIIENKENEE